MIADLAQAPCFPVPKVCATTHVSCIRVLQQGFVDLAQLQLRARLQPNGLDGEGLIGLGWASAPNL